jgi:hypothetical protein
VWDLLDSFDKVDDDTALLAITAPRPGREKARGAG